MNNILTTFTALILFSALLLIPDTAWAASSGADLGLGELLDWLINLIQGPLGKIIALTAFIVGIIAGIAHGSFLSIAVGIGFAIVLYYGPNVIVSVFGATLPVASLL